MDTSSSISRGFCRPVNECACYPGPWDASADHASKLASDDFINNGASFYDNLENIDLTVQTVNVPTPEPGSLTLLAVGLVALALLLLRHGA